MANNIEAFHVLQPDHKYSLDQSSCRIHENHYEEHRKPYTEIFPRINLVALPEMYT